MFWDKVTQDNVFFVLIDFQQSFFNILDKKMVKLSRSNIDLMIKMFNELKVPMVGTEHYRKGLGATDEQVMQNWKGPQMADKVTFSCVGCDPFVEDLEKLNRKVAIVAGLETHICVMQTTLDLIRKGHEVLVVKDACLSSSKLKWENGLELMKEAGAKIVNTETVLFYLLQRVDKPEFKKLVKLLKEQKAALD
ncbi:MAG: isochorismatase family protein [Bacteriovoracia bacterium]